MPTTYVTADFAQWVDYPLVKTKFGVFNSGLVREERYARALDRFREVNPESLRIDLGWGAPWIGWPQDPVTGSADDIHYDFNEMDGIARLMNSVNCLPYWSYCYTPVPLQQPPGDWKSIPSSMEKWGDIVAEFARHYRDTHGENSVGYHEICNEPDNRDFFIGSLSDYLEQYREGSLAIRRVDPDALIGGPALAFTLGWIAPFLNYVAQHALPLDFFSYHWYGSTNYGGITFPELQQQVRDAVANRPEFATTEFHINEYNTYPVDYPAGGRQEKHALAAGLLSDYKYFIEQPDITLVHWAQFLDSGLGNYSGMVSMDGFRRATFNAYKLYTMMPVDRYALNIEGADGVDGLASSDTHKASLVLWNRSEQEQTVAIDLKHLPFPRVDLHVYRIDADHASWGDDPANEILAVVETRTDVETQNLTWLGAIPSGGIVYFEAENRSTETLQSRNIARWMRTLHYYPDRSKTAYADFDKNTWTARLGMASEDIAEAVVGVTAEALPESLDVRFEVDGALHQVDANSLLGLRVDFEVRDIYAKGVLFHGNIYNAQRSMTMSWGTRRSPDQVVAVENLAQFRVDLAALAPANWSGRAQITFLLQNTGAHTRAKIILS